MEFWHAAAIAAFVVAFLWFNENLGKTEVTEWLEEQGKGHLAKELEEAGVITLRDLAGISTKRFMSLRLVDVWREVREVSKDARGWLELIEWLERKKLEDVLPVLKQNGVVSLDRLRMLSETQWTSIIESVENLSLKLKVENVASIVHAERRDEGIRSDSFTGHGHFWKKVFTDFITEKWRFSDIWKRLDKLRHRLAAPVCTITWENSGEVEAGKTITFLAEVYTWNMQPYTRDDVEAVLEVIVTHPNGDSTAAVKSRVGDAVGENHQVQVSFPTRKSGDYAVSVKAKGHNIPGSPFIRKVVAGSVDSSKSGLVRFCRTAVVVQGMYQSLEVELKDQHGNPVDKDKENNAVLIQVFLSESDSADESVSLETIVNSKDQMGQFEVLFKVNPEGYFMGSIKYDGNPLGNGYFSLLCINGRLSTVVKSHVDKRSVFLWFECRLMWDSTGKSSKPGKLKKVYCYVTPKQIIVKEFYLYVFPKRLFTFRLQPKTKLLFGDSMSPELHNLATDRRRSSVASVEEARLALNRNRFMSETDDSVRASENMFTLDDGHQQVTLISAKRNELAATYLEYLSKNMGGSETFQERKEFFFQELCSHHSKRSRHSKLVVVNRSNLLAHTMKVVKDYKTGDWCRSWTVMFSGEEGYDVGGVSREFFTVITNSIFDASHGYFEHFKDDNQALVHPNHSIQCSKVFEFAGRIVGKCLLETAHDNVRLVKARFTRSFLAQLIGLRINYGFFETDDPDLYVSKIEYLRDNDAEDLELVFAEEEYNDRGQVSKVVPLKHHGDEVAVTNQNKLEYLDLLAQYRLVTRVENHVEAFERGLNEIVPMDLLSFFNENELELLMCGSTEFSVEDLKTHCDTDFFYSSRVIDWFWQAVESFTQEELSKLLQFTTGSSQLPPGGFGELTPPFRITRSPTSDALPTAHTCFNQLCLPDYHSFEQLHRSLVLAITEGSEGFGMI